MIDYYQILIRLFPKSILFKNQHQEQFSGN